MFNKALVSPIALAFGLALTGAAAAQTWVGEQEVTDADLGAVQTYCDALNAEEMSENDPSAGPEDANAMEGEYGAAGDDALTTVDLNAITLQDCRDAGLIL